MMTADVYAEGRLRDGVPLEDAMAAITRPDAFLWIDLRDPTEEELDALQEAFGFHPLAMEDVRKQGQRPKVDVYGTYLFLTVHSWEPGEETEHAIGGELDMFLGDRYLVTVQQGGLGALAEARRRWERRPEMIPPEPSYLLYYLLDTVVDGYFPAMDQLDDAIDGLETSVFQSDGGDLDIAPALDLKRRLMHMRQSMVPLRDLLNELLRTDAPLVAPGTRVYLQDVYDHTLRLVEQVDLHRDMLNGVMEAVLAQVSNRMNRVMKTLTVVSTVLMASSLVTGYYGMNFTFAESSWRMGPGFAILLMGTTSVVLLSFFRRIRWL